MTDHLFPGGPFPVVSGAGWRAASAAPHRLFFLGGATYAVVIVALWVLQQASLYAGLLPPFSFTVPFPFAHGWMMVYGVLGFYIFGFLLTTFPRWLAGSPVRKGVYVTAWAFLVAGSHLFWLGLLLSPALVMLAEGLTLVGYAIATGQCIAILSRSENPARYQQKFISFGLLAGMAGQAGAGWAVASGAPWAYGLSLLLGLNLFLLVIIFAVVYRMVPFFTSVITAGLEPHRSPYAIHVFTALLVARFALAVLRLPEWLWLVDLSLAVVLAREMVVWRFWRAPAEPLLVILYLALFWILLGLALSGAESLYLLGSGATVAPFRRAALHAITVGGFGSLLIGISTRVTLGHSGRGLVSGGAVTALLYGYQVVPVTRVLPDVIGHWYPFLAVQGYWSGLLWVAACVWWLAMFAPILVRPRSDGRPG